METTTSKCRDYGHPEIIIRCDESIPRVDVDWLISLLEDAVRCGRRFLDGELIQVGWMLVRISSTNDNRLFLAEPDMQSIPIVWASRVTETLRHIRLQKDTAESLGLGDTMEMPTIRESAIVGVDCGEGSENLILERSCPSETDSGWFFGVLNSLLDYNAAENLRRISLYEVAVKFPNIVMFLSLPRGVKVVCSADRISVSMNGNNAIPRANSFLEQLAIAKLRQTAPPAN